jgi:hypothetical protein
MVQGICAKLPHREKETMNFSQPTIDLSKPTGSSIRSKISNPKGRYKKVHLDFVVKAHRWSNVSQTPTIKKPRDSHKPTAHCVMSQAHKFDLKAHSSCVGV